MPHGISAGSWTGRLPKPWPDQSARSRGCRRCRCQSNRSTQTSSHGCPRQHPWRASLDLTQWHPNEPPGQSTSKAGHSGQKSESPCAYCDEGSAFTHRLHSNTNSIIVPNDFDDPSTSRAEIVKPILASLANLAYDSILRVVRTNGRRQRPESENVAPPRFGRGWLS